MSLKFDWKNLENLEICVPNLCVCSLSCGQAFVTSWTVAHGGPLFMEFFSKNTAAGYQFLLQRIFPTQGSNPCLSRLLHWRANAFHCATWEAHDLN